MKTQLLATIALTLSTSLLIGQSVQHPLTPNSGTASDLKMAGTALTHSSSELKQQMAVCSDKVTYVDRNNTGNPSGDYVQVGGTGPISWAAAMQSFPDYNGQITRIDFKAVSYSGTKTVQASIHNVDVNYVPIGAPLGSVNVNVGPTVAEYGAVLPSAVTVSSGNGFAVVIWDISSGNDSIKIMTNALGSGDGTGMSNLFYNATIYNVLNDLGADIDILLRPTIQFSTPTVTLGASPTTVCAGASVNFYISNSPSYPIHYFGNFFNPNGTAYILNFGDGSPNGSTSSASHAYATGGSYQATLTEIYDGWSSNCNGDPSSQNITVNPAPNSGFNWSANQLAVTFTNTSTNATTYAWLFGDAGSSAAPNPVHNYAASGTYTVELTATGPCGSDYYTTNITITDSTSAGSGITDLSNQLLVNLYPNPVNDMFTLQIESSRTTEIQIEVLSPVGQVISQKNIPSTNNTAVAFDISAYASGIYFVRITQGTSRITKPVMKN